MNSSPKRILIVDDNLSIHEDFRKILSLKTDASKEIDDIENFLFNETSAPKIKLPEYHIDHAYQGEEAIVMVKKAELEGNPYSLIFMDVRMPPGMDGIETISEIWKNHPFIEMVICTAYSDYTWDEILDKFGETDQLLFTKKPFNVVAIKQLAFSLSTKWDSARKNREHQEYLELEVKRRTLELESLLSHMRILKDKAEQSDKMKSVFLSNMSHEIRNPLNSILGFTELLERKKDLPDDKKQHFLQTINSSGKNLLRLINDIIDLAKIEAGHLKLQNEVVNLNVLFRELECFFDLEAKTKGKANLNIILEPLSSDDQVTVFVDALRIKQVMFNLLHNAVKFTKDGFVKFGVKRTDANHLYFFVEDSGIGIIKEKHDVIFKRFMQAEMSEEERDGTGLGLAIAFNIVKLYGGSLQLKSEPNKGTLFYFTMPIEQTVNDNTNLDASSRPCCDDYNWEGKSILIAEDEEPNFILLQEMLENTKINITWAKDGQIAIDLFDSQQHFDLVLTDIRMPRVDGYGLLRHIKSIDESKVVIAQSGFAMLEERKKFLDYGFDAYLEKPIDFARLLYVINSYM